jgi:hypothetical protein
LIENLALDLNIKRPRLYEIVRFSRVYPTGRGYLRFGWLGRKIFIAKYKIKLPSEAKIKKALKTI